VGTGFADDQALPTGFLKYLCCQLWIGLLGRRVFDYLDRQHQPLTARISDCREFLLKPGQYSTPIDNRRCSHPQARHNRKRSEQIAPDLGGSVRLRNAVAA